MKTALYFEKTDDDKVKCTLCPHYCFINEGKTGICKVRRNSNSELFSESYGKVSAIHVDPIEKKPLFHYYPGSNIISVGGIGCNLKCKFCQNWDISQVDPELFKQFKEYSVDDIIDRVLQAPSNLGIAYTYNEPTVWYEYMLDIAKIAQEKNLKNVIVTNGYINEKPLAELLDYMDAFNVDLKSFSDEFYKKITFSTLEPVKRSIKQIKAKGKHLEITNLIIPSLNDNEEKFEELVKWVAAETGPDTPLHLSRYFPAYKLSIPPTPIYTLDKLYDIARKHLNYVYQGNVGHGSKEDTVCHKCGTQVIKRTGYHTEKLAIDDNGNCVNCGNHIVIQ